MLNNKTILITGGTGSFGKFFVKRILKKYKNIKKLIIFSRDELKQQEMSQELNERKYKCLRFFLGDVRDKERLLRAFNNVDIVIHAAALKQVPTAEYNPIEFIKTNILGAQNIIESAIEKKVKKVIALSTDKAAAPINLYGATKLCSDKLFVAANNYSGIKSLSFSVVRYGNVMGSRGSIIPILLKASMEKVKYVNITDKRMTRFNISLEESVDMVLFTIKNSIGGEIFVPKLASYRIMDLVKAISKNFKIKKIGLRQGEKINEEMITVSDSLNTLDIGKYYLILPKIEKKYLKFFKKFKPRKVKENFSYNSGLNENFLNIMQIKNLIRKHVDNPLLQ